jgi:hypothetical protein
MSVVQNFCEFKQCLVREIGFEGMLDLPNISKLDLKFSSWIMSKVNTTSRAIEISDTKVLKFSAGDVYKELLFTFRITMRSNFENNTTSVFCILIPETTVATAFIFPYLPSGSYPCSKPIGFVLYQTPPWCQASYLVCPISSLLETAASRFVDIYQNPCRISIIQTARITYGLTNHIPNRCHVNSSIIKPEYSVFQ